MTLLDIDLNNVFESHYDKHVKCVMHLKECNKYWMDG